MTRVTIVTPSYNQAPYLETTIRSVLEQEYPELEYMVIDGGSTDGSVEVIQKYADYLAYWVSEKDAGQAEAIRKGLARAQGEIVAWLNSDDYYLPGAIAAAVRAFEQHPEAVLVYGNMLAVDENGQTINLLDYKQLTLNDLLCFQIIGQPAVFFRREAYERGGGLDPNFHFLLDHHLWIRMAQQGAIRHIPQRWAAARFHASAKNRAQAVKFGKEAFRIIDWLQTQPFWPGLSLRLQRRIRASAHRVNARYLLDGGKPANALTAWLRAAVLDPSVALARLNILVSALLALTGLSRLRNWVLGRRTRRLAGNR